MIGIPHIRKSSMALDSCGCHLFDTNWRVRPRDWQIEQGDCPFKRVKIYQAPHQAWEQHAISASGGEGKKKVIGFILLPYEEFGQWCQQANRKNQVSEASGAVF